MNSLRGGRVNVLGVTQETKKITMSERENLLYISKNMKIFRYFGLVLGPALYEKVLNGGKGLFLYFIDFSPKI